LTKEHKELCLKAILLHLKFINAFKSELCVHQRKKESDKKQAQALLGSLLEAKLASKVCIYFQTFTIYNQMNEIKIMLQKINSVNYVWLSLEMFRKLQKQIL
jgi:hypothetical protein